LQARIASWRENAAAPEAAGDPELQMAQPKPPPVKIPDMPWKKKPKVTTAPPPPSGQAGEDEPKT
jgi:hypothetical protein